MSSDHLPRIFITADEEKLEQNGPTLSQLLDRELGLIRASDEEAVAVPNHEKVDDLLRTSAKELVVLVRDGRETVTNVAVADDRREIRRRMDEAKLRDELLQVLQNESHVAMDKFRDICRHWVALDEVRDPVSMYHGLEQQKQRISKLMLQKDAIIDECRKELIVADENYYRNQAKQSEDLQCLVERINEHVETMKRAYRQQLERLQKTIADERNRMTQETDTAWTDLFDQKRIHENEKLDEQKNQLMANDRELEALVLSHEELIRTTKCRLESDNDCLQLELQKTKADVLLNTQKLDYNFEVLKRREEESVRNQQKKRLTKQHVEHVDEIVRLRQTLKETDAMCGKETQSLRANITKIKEQIRDLQQSAMVTSKANDDKYKQCWEMNQNDCLKLVDDIGLLTSRLTELELGRNVERQQEVSHKSIKNLPSYQVASRVLNDGGKPLAKNDGPVGATDGGVLNGASLKKLCDLVIESTEFVHDERSLLQVLGELDEEDSRLVSFSNLLQTFGVSGPEDMETFLSVFKKYMWCKKCSSPDTECGNQHEYVVEPDDILSALYQLRGLLQRDDPCPDPPRDGTEPTLSRLLNHAEVARFWKQFEELFTKDQEQLWTALEYGLKQYLLVLKERENLFEDCEQLRKQNAELNRLLGNNEMSYINAET